MRAWYIREQKHILGTSDYAEVDLFETTDKEHTASTRRKRELATSIAQQILKAKSLEIQVGGATVTISEGGEIKVTSPAGITLAASGELKMTASTINATAGTVNIQGGGGDVVVSGKSLVSHTHTGNLGKKTSAPL